MGFSIKRIAVNKINNFVKNNDKKLKFRLLCATNAAVILLVSLHGSALAFGGSTLLPSAGVSVFIDGGIPYDDFVKNTENEIAKLSKLSMPAPKPFLKVITDLIDVQLAAASGADSEIYLSNQQVSDFAIVGADQYLSQVTSDNTAQVASAFDVPLMDNKESVSGSEVKSELKLEEKSETNTLSKAVSSIVPPAPSASDTQKADETTEPVADEAAKADNEEEHFKNLVIAKVHDYVNVRSLPGEDGEILGKLYDKSVGEFVSEENGWYLINSGNVTGYVKGEFVVTGEAAVDLAKQVGIRMAVVNTQTLFVRQEPNVESAVMGMVPDQEELVVTEELDGWVRVSVEEGDGYVSKDYVSLHTEFIKAESKAEEEARLKKEKEARDAANAAARSKVKKTESTNTNTAAPVNYAVSGGSDAGRAVAEFGLQFVGNPYVFGGSSLTNGADCSGFVMSVYANFGVGLPHSSKADRSAGSAVSGIAEAAPGDLICYSGHVAIYIGDGKIVHASTAKTGIVVSNALYRTPLAIRRIF